MSIDLELLPRPVAALLAPAAGRTGLSEEAQAARVSCISAPHPMTSLEAETESSECQRPTLSVSSERLLLPAVPFTYGNKPKLLSFLDLFLLFKINAGIGKTAEHFCKACVAQTLTQQRN